MNRIMSFETVYSFLLINFLILFTFHHGDAEIIPARFTMEDDNSATRVHHALSDDEEGQPEPEPEQQDSGHDSTGDSALGQAITTCGGVLEGLTGVISYKVGQTFDNNERCTWTIHAPNAAKITFTLEENGLIQKTEDNIKVSFFNDHEYKALNNYKEVSILHYDMNKTVTVPGPVAFVRFYSDGKIRGLGFRITYSGAEITEPIMPCKYTNQFFNKNFGIIQYAASTPLERASFGIKPTVDIMVALKYFNGNCAAPQKDYLTVYNRGRNGRPKFEMMQQLCNASVSMIPNWKVTSMEEILITFQTNTDIVNNEFQIIWAPT